MFPLTNEEYSRTDDKASLETYIYIYIYIYIYNIYIYNI